MIAIDNDIMRPSVQAKRLGRAETHIGSSRVSRAATSPTGLRPSPSVTLAAKSMAMTAVDLFSDPTHIQKARAEFDRKRGPNFVYKTRLPDRKPALDYRK